MTRGYCFFYCCWLFVFLMSFRIFAVNQVAITSCSCYVAYGIYWRQYINVVYAYSPFDKISNWNKNVIFHLKGSLWSVCLWGVLGTLISQELKVWLLEGRLGFSTPIYRIYILSLVEKSNSYYTYKAHVLPLLVLLILIKMYY